MNTIDQYNFKDKKALIRVDFNVPLDKDFTITDDKRMRAALPTIQKVLGDGGSVILMSHLGRPKGGPEDKYSLKHILGDLSRMLDFQVKFASDCVGADAQTTPKPVNNLDKGNFKAGFSPITKSKNPKKAMSPEVSQILQELTQPLNEMIALPFDVYLNFDECGEPNAFYDRQAKEITMCLEFMETFEEAFRKISQKQIEIDEMSSGTAVFFFFHELGHCLIDVWDVSGS